MGLYGLEPPRHIALGLQPSSDPTRQQSQLKIILSAILPHLETNSYGDTLTPQPLLDYLS